MSTRDLGPYRQSDIVWRNRPGSDQGAFVIRAKVSEIENDRAADGLSLRRVPNDQAVADKCEQGRLELEMRLCPFSGPERLGASESNFRKHARRAVMNVSGGPRFNWRRMLQ